MPEIILLVVHHPQHVCVGRRGRQSPSEGLIMSSQPLYTSQPDSGEHRGIHLSPTLTPLGFTSSSPSIIQGQSNYMAWDQSRRWPE